MLFFYNQDDLKAGPDFNIITSLEILTMRASLIKDDDNWQNTFLSSVVSLLEYAHKKISDDIFCNMVYFYAAIEWSH